MKTFLITAVTLLAAAGAMSAQEAVSPTASPKPEASPLPGVAQAERVVVSGGAIERSETDTAQPVVILNENNMKLATAPTLGDTLAAQPGISASGFTPRSEERRVGKE